MSVAQRSATFSFVAFFQMHRDTPISAAIVCRLRSFLASSTCALISTNNGFLVIRRVKILMVSTFAVPRAVLGGDLTPHLQAAQVPDLG